MNYVTNEPNDGIEVERQDPILVAAEQTSPAANTHPAPIVVQTGSGGGVGGMSGALMVILLLALVTMIFFGSDLHTKLKDWLKDILDITTGHGDDQVEVITDDSGNPQASEVGSTYKAIATDWVSWKYAMFICGLRDGTVRTASSLSEAQDAEPKIFRFSNAWNSDEIHDVAYFDGEGLLRFGSVLWHFQDYADADDQQWNSAFLRVVTLGFWFIAEYTAPRNAWCVVDAVGIGGDSGSYLEDAQLMYYGNIPNGSGEGAAFILRKMQRGGFFLGTKPIPIATLSVTSLRLVDAQDDRRTIDVERWSITGSRCYEAQMDEGSFFTIAHRPGLEFGDLTPGDYRNMQTINTIWSAQRGDAIRRATLVLQEVNECLDILLTNWAAEGRDPNLKPNSIPGCLVPSNPINLWYCTRPNRDVKTHIWEDLKAGRIKTDTWMWEVINRFQLNYSDYRFCYCECDAAGGKKSTIIQAEGNGGATWKERCRDAACELAAVGYWIYLTQFAIDGRSLFRMAFVGAMWGRNVWIGDAPSTTAAINLINQSQTDENTASAFSWLPTASEVPTLEDVEINERVLENKCLPNTCVWIKQGAPSSYLNFSE